MPLRHIRPVQRGCELRVHDVHADDVPRFALGGRLDVEVRAVRVERVEPDRVYGRFSVRVRCKLLQRWYKVRDVRRRDEPRWIHLVCSVHVQRKHLEHRLRVRSTVWGDVSRRCGCRFRVQLPDGPLEQRLLLHADCRNVRRWDLWSVEWCVHCGAV